MLRQLTESFKNDLRNNPRLVWIFGGVMVFVLVCVAGGIAVSCWTPEKPDPKTASMDKIEGYLASKHYMELSLDERKQYVSSLMERMDKTKNPTPEEPTGEIMKRLWERNRKAATSVQITAMSSRMEPISSLPDKEKGQRINMFLNMAEMTQGRQKMQEHYNNMFGQTGKGARNQNKMLTEAIRAMPTAMNSTTPEERRKMIKTIVIAKKQMDRRYGGQSATSQPANNK